VATVYPSAGPAGGGSWVKVTGWWFSGATSVDFGAVSATSFRIISGYEIEALAPPHAPGTVEVVVVGAAGPGGGSSSDQYSYDQ
jgi:hypothetical protein